MKTFLKKLIEYFDSIWYSSLTAKLSVASFTVGTVIVLVCLFCVIPIGTIELSALQASGMFLILSGAFGGCYVTFDLLNSKFENKISKLADKLIEKEIDEDERRG